MNVTIKVLGRVAVDQPFAELSTVTVALGAAALALTPAVPVGAAGQELQIRVAPEANVMFAIGPWLDPATQPAPTPILDGQGQTIGQAPAPTPLVRARYAATGGGLRDAPFCAGDSLILGPPGANLAAA